MPCVVHGEATEELLRLAASTNADLVGCGTSRRLQPVRSDADVNVTYRAPSVETTVSARQVPARQWDVVVGAAQLDLSGVHAGACAQSVAAQLAAHASAESSAAVGPSKVASTPSPVVLTSRPP